jgi:hypothetical protein
MPHPPSPTDPFRINQRLGYAGTLPAAPVPISPATSWYDVSNWQTYLVSIGLLGAGYPSNQFDMTTHNATETFQGSTQWGAAVPINGIVTLATYNKAVAAGMPAYSPTVTT